MVNIEGFSVKNWKDFRGIEDSYDFHITPKGVELIAVADGITRDPKGMKILPDFRNPLHIVKSIGFFRNYDGTPAKKVADLFCLNFLQYAEQEGVKKTFQLTNTEIGIYGCGWLRQQGKNESDFLEADYPGCVGTGVFISKGVVNYGFIADCGLAIFNNSGEIVFRTPNEGPNSKGSIDEDVAKKYKTGFRFPEGRKIIRSLYRNNPSEKLAYGSLTGEKEAMHYVRTGQFELGDNALVVYSDGLEHVVYSTEFSKEIKEGRDLKSIKRLCQKKVRSEGSLVLRR